MLWSTDPSYSTFRNPSIGFIQYGNWTYIHWAATRDDDQLVNAMGCDIRRERIIRKLPRSTLLRNEDDNHDALANVRGVHKSRTNSLTFSR